MSLRPCLRPSRLSSGCEIGSHHPKSGLKSETAGRMVGDLLRLTLDSTCAWFKPHCWMKLGMTSQNDCDYHFPLEKVGFGPRSPEDTFLLPWDTVPVGSAAGPRVRPSISGISAQ